MMKTFLTAAILAAILAQASCLSHKELPGQISGCPVKKETTAIRYTSHTNSGIAQQTEYTITPDSLEWRFKDWRNGFSLYDMVKYGNEDFTALIDSLSQIPFKVFHENTPPTSGGRGYAYSFMDNKGVYLGYGSSNNIASGKNDQAEEMIGDFIETHKTDGQKTLEDVEEKLRREIGFVNYDPLPEELEKYVVKEP